MAWSTGNWESAWVDLVNVKKETTVYNCELDLEVQFTDVTYTLSNEFLCIYSGNSGSENLRVDVRNGSTWNSLITLSPGWNNVTVASYLNSSTFTIRFKGATETSDPDQNSWQIDAVLLNLSGTNPDTYVLDLEAQWVDIPYIFPNEVLAIYAGTLGNESLRVDVWSEGTWNTLIPALSSGWNNASITPYLNSSTFTIRFKGTLESGDTYRNTWQIDTTLIRLSGTLPPSETEIASDLSLSNTTITYGNNIVQVEPGMWLVYIPPESNLDVYLWLRTSYTVPYGQYQIVVGVALNY
jgi:hypothetical protein